MSDTTKRQREILEFVQKYQKDTRRQSVSADMQGNLYGNTVWSHLFFENARPNAPIGKPGKSKGGAAAVIYPD